MKGHFDALGNHRAPVEIRGWASDNHAIDEVPAVIANPDAQALTLLSWGIAQLQQCNALLDALGTAEDGQERSVHVLAAVLHFLMQAESALLAGMQGLRDIRRG